MQRTGQPPQALLTPPSPASSAEPPLLPELLASAEELPAPPSFAQTPTAPPQGQTLGGSAPQGAEGEKKEKKMPAWLAKGLSESCLRPITSASP